MQIATWNVNSIRTRLEQVLTWLESQGSLDVLCLQETKVVDEDFPRAAFEERGFHVEVYGQKSYNGVALVSRDPLEKVERGFAALLPFAEDLDDQKRLISTVYHGIRILNLYVPNGSEVGSDKYAYKLRWLRMLKDYLTVALQQGDPMLICGDFNIAPEDRDIYDPKKAGEIMASEPERQALREILALGFHDAFRKFTADPGHFSWWDYRSGGFQRNRGWRIDHHYLTADLYEKATACWIDIEPRRAEKPSDHTPVIVAL
ncbi:MAG: exodeoxyribonuclease III [Thermostichus sp. HHBFW_bins_43]